MLERNVLAEAQRYSAISVREDVEAAKDICANCAPKVSTHK